MWKRLGVLAFSLLVGVLVVMSGGQIGANAATSGTDLTAQASGVKAPESIREDGISEPIPVGTDLQSGQNYTLRYTWSMPDKLRIHAGDTVTVTLPATASYTGATQVDVKNSDNPKVSVGTMTQDKTDSHKFVITFNDSLSQTNVGRAGTINFYVQGNKSDGSGSGGSDTSLIKKSGWIPSGVSNSSGIPGKVEWQIVVNPNGKNLGDVTVKDLIGPHQTFDEDTQDVPVASLADGSKFPISYSGSGSSVTFNLKNVTQKIDIFYFSKVLTADYTGQTWGQFSNYAELTSTSGGSDTTANPGTADGVPATDAVVKNFTWGLQADMGGTYLGGVQLTKTALGDPKTVLSGAIYDLQRLATDGTWANYQSGLSTDSKGVLTDPSLEPGTYRLVETAAPDGYLLANKDSDTAVTPATFLISTEDASPTHTLTQSDRPNGATLTKTDPAGKAVPGATYRLVKGAADGPDDTAVVKSDLVTDAQGQVTVNLLSPGTYYYEETAAPSGYEKNPDSVKVTITNRDTSVQTVTQTDKPINSGESSSGSSASSSTGSTTETTTSSSGTSSSTSDISSSSSNTKTSAAQTSSTTTSSHSTSVTKTTHGIVAAVGANHSNSTSSSPKGGHTAGTAANRASRTAAHRANDNNRYLPRTSGQRGLLAMLIGFFILGLSIASWQWRQGHRSR